VKTARIEGGIRLRADGPWGSDRNANMSANQNMHSMKAITPAKRATGLEGVRICCVGMSAFFDPASEDDLASIPIPVSQHEKPQSGEIASGHSKLISRILRFLIHDYPAVVYNEEARRREGVEEFPSFVKVCFRPPRILGCGCNARLAGEDIDLVPCRLCPCDTAQDQNRENSSRKHRLRSPRG